MKMSLLERALFDECHRREANLRAVDTLFTYFKLHSSDSAIKDVSKIFDKLDSYIATMQRIDVYNDKTTQTCATAKNNRMVDIFNNTKYYLDRNYDNLYQSSSLKDVFDVATTSINSTQLLFLIVALIASIDLLCDERLYTKCPAEVKDILNPRESPILHGTPLSPNFNITNVGTNLTNFPFIYFNNYTDNHELMIPTIGYLYAGDRCDRVEYKSKRYKSHDCSSSLVEWVGAKDYFSSLDLIEFEQFYCRDSQCISCDKLNKFEQMRVYMKPFCKSEAKSLIQYVFDPRVLSEINRGLIFVVENESLQRHSGLVTGVFEDGCLETLSYYHLFPFAEGLGYGMLCIGDVRNIYLFHNAEDVTEAETLGNITYSVFPYP